MREFEEELLVPPRTFTERFDGVLVRYARRTNEATELLTAFALQSGGEGGARLARKAGVPISPDTLLAAGAHDDRPAGWNTSSAGGSMT
jgi:hypothetical protein